MCVGEEFADKMNLVTRTIIINGVNVTKCNLQKIILNDNPNIKGILSIFRFLLTVSVIPLRKVVYNNN